jgi:hypothetical protein
LHLRISGGRHVRHLHTPPVVLQEKPGGDVINIFTVASGHMYERLQKIMVLSVIKDTQSRVKFWFIKNYMSPQHKQVSAQCGCLAVLRLDPLSPIFTSCQHKSR